MRIGVLTPWEFVDPNAWSGVLAHMRQALEGRAEIVELSSSGTRTALVDRAAARLSGLATSKKYLWDHSIATARKRGNAATALIARAKPDVVLAIAASTDLAYVDPGEIPVVQVGDATFAAIHDYYPMYSDVQPLSALQANRIEALAARKTRHFVMASQWAIDSLVSDYGVAKSSCSVGQFGPALAPSSVRPRQFAGTSLRALVVTSDWERKGGDMAVRTVRTIREQGLDVELSVVGKAPATLPGWVRNLGRLPREELAAEYEKADVLLELAVANCGGVTMTDAAAFGLPVIATDTGGVASIVVDGSSGILVSTSAVGVKAGDALRRIVSGDVRSRLSVGARHQHEAVLNWQTWAETVVTACEGAITR